MVIAAGLIFLSTWHNSADADEPNEKSMAAYADAANFQTNGALSLAIEGWTDFLKKHPESPMASKAAHYLGVCYMQQAQPDYVAATHSFQRALKDTKYDLREESLANYGWCLYASAGNGPTRDEQKLSESLKAFGRLRQEFPKSRFLDRAMFYSGEAAYGLGNTEDAIKYYDQLLALPNAKESPLRCDALYARGVAYEDLDQIEKAIASFKQLVSGCEKPDLITDVHLRMGDAAILRKEYDEALVSFDAAIASTDSEEDLAYALFRQAFALVQAERPDEAAKKYEQLLADHPKSRYTAAATLAAAQTAYRSGDIDSASTRFAEVLEGSDPAAATEAAHWLARIYLSDGDTAKAVTVAKEQIDRGVKGEFATALRLDQAEALAMDPKTVGDSAKLFEKTYRDAPSDPLAPRALYNAAFSLLQVGDGKKSLKLTKEFLESFPSDTLASDVRFIAAESYLMTGDTKMAARSYQELLASTPTRGNMQRPLWVLRAATTANAAGQHADTIALLKKEGRSLKEPSQIAAARMLLGHAHMAMKEYSDAATMFASVIKTAPQGQRADEAQVMVGQALMAAGNEQGARDAWEKLVSTANNRPMADRARYKLAQLAASDGRFTDAVALYEQIIRNDTSPDLLPYARYGLGWSRMQAEQYEQAIPPLDQVIQTTPDHPITDEALLARGISKRNLRLWPEAKQDLEGYLATAPTGTNLGHALYELALIDQQEKKPQEAAKRLAHLVNEVPDYPATDKVLYELAWSLRESGKEAESEKRFSELTQRFPDSNLTGEAAFFVGQKYYTRKQWKPAAQQFGIAARRAGDDELSEKALYRLGWSHFKLKQYEQAREAFKKQAAQHLDGKLVLDALMMVGECYFKQATYPQSLEAYSEARERIIANDDTAKVIRDPSERQVRELILLHGGQSAAQLKQWESAIDWYDELIDRFPATVYLPQAFYEKGHAYQQMGKPDQAIKFFVQVADNYRSETAARARFMVGEIHFGNREFDKAIPEFQRVMFGFGAEKAPESIKNWQAKSGFEAGRCSEMLIQQAKTPAARKKSKKFAEDFFRYVITSHPKHELATQSRDRLEALTKS